MRRVTPRVSLVGLEPPTHYGSEPIMGMKELFEDQSDEPQEQAKQKAQQGREQLQQRGRRRDEDADRDMDRDTLQRDADDRFDQDYDI
ncbi:hypothetical protein GCM10010129_54910 [Streptomyces fumigatiscleroticus]|nr:hypothetical protein GCM10010129_54910 [Streptomyces fumigatiscleroticus]